MLGRIIGVMFSAPIAMTTVGLAAEQAPSPVNLMAIAEAMLPGACPPGTPPVERKVVNRHQPQQIDTIKKVSCQAADIEMYVGATASDPTGLPIYLQVRKPSAGLPNHMNIGQPLLGLVSLQGKPDQRDDRSVTYLEEGGSVTFGINEGRITSIRWQWDWGVE